MGRALPCLIRIVAACPRSRSIRVCASHNKTFPGREAFILIQPGRRDPCSRDWPGYAASERPFWMPLAGASGRWPVPSGGTHGPCRLSRRAGYPVPCRLSRRAGYPVPCRDRRPAAGSRPKLSPAASSPRPLRLPGPSVRQASEPRVPGQASEPRVPQTAKRTAGPRTIQSGGQRCDPAGPPPAPELQGVHAGLSGSGPTRADNALLWESLATVLPVGGCRRGSAP
jgi:hypothetical protein